MLTAHFPEWEIEDWEVIEPASDPICQWVTLSKLCLALNRCFLSSETGPQDEWPHTASAPPMHWDVIWSQGLALWSSI